MANETNIPQFIEKINKTNSSNDKIETLTSYKSDKLVQRVLKMCYDKVAFTYGVTLKNVRAGSSENRKDLSDGLDRLEKLARREVTGNAAISLVEDILEDMSEANRDVIEKILKRDLRINLGRTNINKVMKGLITKPIYMRCDIGTKENINKNISFPAISELKADGTYRECSVSETPSFISRSGESYSYANLENMMCVVDKGYYHGEMTIICDDAIIEIILPKLIKNDKLNGTSDAEELVNNYNRHKKEGREYILPRSLGNGLLNSDNIPYDNIVFEVWDYITDEEYKLAGNLKSLKKECQDKIKSIKLKLENGEITKEEFKVLTKNQKSQNALDIKNGTPSTPYAERLEALKQNINKINNKQIRVIDHKVVNSLKEAYEYASEKMKEGLEGAILKDMGMVYEDGTSKKQLKIKLEIEAEVRVVGFIEGTPGTKRESTFGSLKFANDEGTIVGSTSGFSDKQLEEINSKRDYYMGKVITVQFNDITKSRSSDTYAFSHPRFIEFRDDKDTTDTLERCMEMKEMAMNLE